MDGDIAEQADEAAAHYRAATGVGCVAVAPDGRPFSPSEADSPFPGCAFCAVLQRRSADGYHGCSGIHRYGTAQAERFGGSFIYFCPLNLTHWATPIRTAGVTVSSLIGGPVLLVNHEDYLHEYIHRFSDIGDSGLRDLKDALMGVPYVEPARARSLSRVLAMEAVALSSGEAVGSKQPEPVRTARFAGRRGQSERRLPKYPISKERELLFLIAKGDLDGSRKALNEILGFIFFYSEHDLETIKLRVQELVVLLSRAAIEGGASIEEIIALNDQYLPVIQTAASVYGLSSSLAILLTRFVECVFSLKTVKHADLVQKAVRYIHQNYEKPISLEDVAFHAGVSPSHFSRLFKEGTGQTFIGFLTDTRLRASKELLADPSIPLAEVASSVGFDDQSYFTRVFTKRAGTSPGRYRKRKGLAESDPRVDESNIEIHE
jgi:two-component system response regulator YesN